MRTEFLMNHAFDAIRNSINRLSFLLGKLMGVNPAGYADVGMAHCRRNLVHRSTGFIGNRGEGVAEIMKSDLLHSMLTQMSQKSVR